MSVNSVFAGRYKLLQRFNMAVGIEFWKAEDIKTNDIVSLKLCNAESETYTRAQLLKEYMLLTQIRHQNILTPLHYDDFEGQPYLVYPYTEGNSLRHYLVSHPVLTESAAKKLMLSMAKALEVLHDNRIFHRNIFPGNIFLLNEQYLLGPFRRQSELTNTPDILPYLSPETLNNASSHTEKSDVYSLAVVIYELCRHQLPQKVINAGKHPQLPSHYSENFSALIAACLSVHAEQRPAVEELIKVLEGKETENTKTVIASEEMLPPSIAIAENPAPIASTITKPEKEVAMALAEVPSVAIIKNDNKTVNRLLMAACLLLLFFIGFAKFVPFNNNAVTIPSETVKQEISAQVDGIINVELPSHQLNIASFEPDTVQYENYVEENVANDKPIKTVTQNPKRILMAFRDEDGTYGFKDMNNKLVIMPAYDDVFEFSDGLAAVSVKGLWGFIDTKGNWVIKAQYKKADFFQKGQAKVEQNGHAFIINKSGRCVSGCSEVSQFN
jgi:serine/threonine protein kinase